MIPPIFRAAHSNHDIGITDSVIYSDSGDIGEKIIYDHLKELGNVGMFVVNGFELQHIKTWNSKVGLGKHREYAVPVPKLELRAQKKLDFIIFHHQLGIISLEVKKCTSESKKTLQKAVNKALEQLEVSHAFIKTSAKRIPTDEAATQHTDYASKSAESKATDDFTIPYKKVIALPSTKKTKFNRDDHPSLTEDILLLFEDDSQDISSFRRWWYEAIESQAAIQMSEETKKDYERALSFILMIRHVGPVVEVEMIKEIHKSLLDYTYNKKNAYYPHVTKETFPNFFEWCENVFLEKNKKKKNDEKTDKKDKKTREKEYAGQRKIFLNKHKLKEQNLRKEKGIAFLEKLLTNKKYIEGDKYSPTDEAVFALFERDYCLFFQHTLAYFKKMRKACEKEKMQHSNIKGKEDEREKEQTEKVAREEGREGEKEAGGKEAGGKEAEGREEGGKEVGGKEEGGKEAGGREPGGKEAEGREEGGKEAGGKEEGGEEAGGREEGGKEAGGKEEGGKEAGGKEAGGKEAGGKEGEKGAQKGKEIAREGREKEQRERKEARDRDEEREDEDDVHTKFPFLKLESPEDFHELDQHLSKSAFIKGNQQHEVDKQLFELLISRLRLQRLVFARPPARSRIAMTSEQLAVFEGSEKQLIIGPPGSGKTELMKLKAFQLESEMEICKRRKKKIMYILANGNPKYPDRNSLFFYHMKEFFKRSSFVEVITIVMANESAQDTKDTTSVIRKKIASGEYDHAFIDECWIGSEPGEHEILTELVHGLPGYVWISSVFSFRQDKIEYKERVAVRTQPLLTALKENGGEVSYINQVMRGTNNIIELERAYSKVYEDRSHPYGTEKILGHSHEGVPITWAAEESIEMMYDRCVHITQRATTPAINPGIIKRDHLILEYQDILIVDFATRMEASRQLEQSLLDRLKTGGIPVWTFDESSTEQTEVSLNNIMESITLLQAKTRDVSEFIDGVEWPMVVVILPSEMVTQEAKLAEGTEKLRSYDPYISFFRSMVKLVVISDKWTNMQKFLDDVKPGKANQ